MLTEKVIVNGIEYQVSAHTYKMLKDAKEQLIKSIERYEQEHPSAPIPEKKIPGVELPATEEQLPLPKTPKKTTTNESTKKTKGSSK